MAGGMFAGIYSGVKYDVGILYNDISGTPLNDIVDTQLYYHGESSIVAIIMFPRGIIDNSENGSSYTDHPLPYILHHSVTRPSTLGSITNGYVPRNKKLLTYPYMYLTVDVLNSAKNYSYEFFAAPALVRFEIQGVLQANPEIGIIPMNYNGIAMNFTENLVMDGFPQCACTIDAYRAWLAQKAAGQVIGAVGTAAGLVVGAATGGIGLAAGIAGGVGLAGQINQMQKDATYGTRARGSQGGSADVAGRGKAIYFKKMSITRQYAERIDGFFDKYGYSQDTFAVPNRKARPHWTYVKTKECNIKPTGAGMPTDAIKNVKEIYNSGITFWKSLSEVGNYALDNRVPLA